MMFLSGGHIKGTQLGGTLRLFAHCLNTPEAICVSCMLTRSPKGPTALLWVPVSRPLSHIWQL